MRQQVIIGYEKDTKSDREWLFWLEKKLEEQGFTASLLELPYLSSDRETWLPALTKQHSIRKERTFFIQHDPGSLTILDYLQQISKNPNAEPAMLVAGNKNITKLIVLYSGRIPDILESKKALAEPKNFAQRVVKFLGGGRRYG